MARFMEIRSDRPNLLQNQIAKDLGCSSSTLQHYGNHINMLSPCRVPSNRHKRRQTLQIVNITSKDLN